MRSSVETRQAEFSRSLGRDALPYFADADRDIAQSGLLFPNQPSTWRQRATNFRKRGHYRLEGGEDPRQDFEEAERCVEESIRLAGGSIVQGYAMRAEIRIDQARLKEKDNDKAGAEELYKAAIADYEKAAALDKGTGRSVAGPLEDARKRLQALRP